MIFTSDQVYLWAFTHCSVFSLPRILTSLPSCLHDLNSSSFWCSVDNFLCHLGRIGLLFYVSFISQMLCAQLIVFIKFRVVHSFIDCQRSCMSICESLWVPTPSPKTDITVVPPYLQRICSKIPSGSLKLEIVQNPADTMIFPIHMYLWWS